MYRHIAEQILENPEKQFVTKSDKDNWNSKSDSVHNHESSYYTKSEIDSELSTSYTHRGGVMVNVKDTRRGVIQELNVPGTVYQGEDLGWLVHTGDPNSDGTYTLPIASRNINIFTTELIPGMIAGGSGNLETSSPNYLSTKDFIRVQGGKKYVFRNKEGICPDMIACYNTTKAYQGYINFNNIPEIELPTSVAYIKFRYRIENVGTDTSAITEIEINHAEDEYPGHYTRPEYRKTNIILPEPLSTVGNTYQDLLYRSNGKLIMEKHTEYITMTKFKVLSNTTDLGNVYRIGFYLDVECPDVLQSQSKYGKELCNQFKYINDWELDSEHFYMANAASTVNRPSIFFFVDKNKVKGEPTNDNMIKYFKQNPVKVLIAREEPRFIEIDDHGKFELPTYDGKTEFFIPAHDKTCSIRGNLPVNIGAQFDSSLVKLKLNEAKLQNIENLVEGQKLEYNITNRSETIMESSEGYITDIELCGNTLVNLLPEFKFDTNDYSYSLPNGESSITIDSEGYAKCTFTGDDWMRCFWHKDLSKYKPDTYYTIVTDVKENTLDVMFDVVRSQHTDSIFDTDVNISANTKGLFVSHVKTRSDIVTGRYVATRNQISKNCSQDTYIKFRQMIFEGKYTKSEIMNHFVGMSSLGETTKGLKLKTTTADNLFDISKLVNTPNSRSYVHGNRFYVDYTQNAPVPRYTKVWSGVQLKGNTFYTIEYTAGSSDPSQSKQYIDIKYLGSNEDDLGSLWISGESKTAIGVCGRKVLTFKTRESGFYQINFYISFDEPLERKYVAYFEDVLMYEGSRKHPYLTLDYKDCRTSEQQIVDSSNNKIVLRSLPNGVCDRIYKSGLNYILERRVGHCVLTEQDQWLVENNAPNQYNTRLFRLRPADNSDMKPSNEYNANCDFFNSDRFKPRPANNSNGTWGTDVEGIGINNGAYLDIRILKSRLVNDDVNGFKEWIKENNINVVYELKRPTYEIIPNIEIETYNNGTKIDVYGGLSLPSKFTFKTSADLAGIMNTLIDKVQKLEEKIPLVKRLSLISALDNLDTEYKLNNLINSTNTK